MIKTVETKEHFKALLQYTILKAQENFEQYAELAHVIIIPHWKGGEIIPFGLLESGLVTTMGASVDAARSGVYRYTALQILALKARGFLEISEAYFMNYKSEPGDVEGAMEKHKAACQKYGSLAEVPGSIEALFIRGRWEGESVMHMYKIGRRDGSRYLYDHVEKWECTGAETRSAPLDMAVETVCGIKR